MASLWRAAAVGSAAGTTRVAGPTTGLPTAEMWVTWPPWPDRSCWGHWHHSGTAVVAVLSPWLHTAPDYSVFGRNASSSCGLAPLQRDLYFFILRTSPHDLCNKVKQSTSIILYRVKLDNFQHFTYTQYTRISTLPARARDIVIIFLNIQNRNCYRVNEYYKMFKRSRAFKQSGLQIR